MFEGRLEYISDWDVVSYDDLLNSLPEQYLSPKGKNAIEQLRYWYHAEVFHIMDVVANLRQQGKPFHAYFGRFLDSEGSSQIVAEFWVKDLSKSRRDEYNWHMQNTSQWVYAGALVVDKHAIERGDERVVSTHH